MQQGDFNGLTLGQVVFAVAVTLAIVAGVLWVMGI